MTAVIPNTVAFLEYFDYIKQNNYKKAK